MCSSQVPCHSRWPTNARLAKAGLIASVLLAGLVLAACGSSGSDDHSSSSSAGGLPSEYTIGVNMGLTGAIAPYDKPALDGFRMAVDEINAKGGIGGKTKIKLILENDRSDAAESAKVAQKLLSQNIDFMVAPGDASVAIPAGRIAQRKKVPMMSILASSPSIVPAVGDYFFSNAASDNMVATGLAKYAFKTGKKNVYTIIGPDASFTTELPQFFEAAFKTAGGTIVGSDKYRTGTQDFGPQITKIRKLSPQPDAIMTSMYEPEFPAFLKQLRAAGVTIPLLESDAIDTPATLELGSLIDGTHAVTYGFPTPGDSLEKFYARFKAKYGSPPPAVFPAIGYDTANIIAAAVIKAGSADGTKVRDAIGQIKDFPGVVGATTFGTSLKGFPIRPVTIQQWNVKPGSSKVTRTLVAKIAIKPEEIPK
jgi:branched-chain amino acid transport system substrate-binding protein